MVVLMNFAFKSNRVFIMFVPFTNFTFSLTIQTRFAGTVADNLIHKTKYVFLGALAGIIVSAMGNYIIKSMLRIAVDSIKNMDIVKEESCSILDNLEEAIISKIEGVRVSINYCNELTL